MMDKTLAEKTLSVTLKRYQHTTRSRVKFELAAPTLMKSNRITTKTRQGQTWKTLF